jgi:DNA-directed RNA polymerase subunit RPC12/RpoP
MQSKGEIIEKIADIKIKCYKCGNEYLMSMMRIGPDDKNLVCRNCLERKSLQKQEQANTEIKKQQQPAFKEYFCKKCKYNFKRAKHIKVSTCPYCGAAGSLMVKGSIAKIMADAAKMKERF